MTPDQSKPEGLHADDGYAIQKWFGCLAVFGKIPVGELAVITSGLSPNAVMDVRAANYSGATLIVGEPKNIKVLRENIHMLPVSKERNADYLSAMVAGAPTPVANWLRGGDRGQSSDALCRVLYGLPGHAGVQHPVLDEEYQRCLAFLKNTHSEHRLEDAAALSPGWEYAVSRLRVMLSTPLAATAPQAIAQTRSCLD